MTPPSRRWEKKRSSHIVHSPVSCTAATPGGRERVPGDRGEVEVALAHARAGDVRERGVDLLAHLVAAAAGARAERGAQLALDAQLAQRGDALGDDPAREAAPAAVQRGDARRARLSMTGQAVGDEDERGELGLRAWPGRPPPHGVPIGPVARRTRAPWTCLP